MDWFVEALSKSDEINRCEDRGMTAVEGEPDSRAAKIFLSLAQNLWEERQ